jgi:hypothetical protein
LLSASNSLDGLFDAEQRAEHSAIVTRTHAVLAPDELDRAAIGELAARRFYPAVAAELARIALALPSDRAARNSSVVLHILDPHVHRPTRVQRVAISFGASASATSGRGYFDESKMHAAALAGSIPARCVYAAIGEPLAPWREESDPRVKAAMALRELVLIFRDGAVR